MKAKKWYTTTLYVDQQTGEQITELEAKQDYVITKQRKIYVEVKINYKNGIGTPTGYKTITKECTKQGKQLRFI